VEFEGNKANVKSSKDLSNIVVYDGCTKIKYDNLSGYYGSFYSENLNNDAKEKTIHISSMSKPRLCPRI